MNGSGPSDPIPSGGAQVEVTDSDTDAPTTAHRTRPRPMSLLRSMGNFVSSYLVAIFGYFGLNVVAARVLGTSGFGYYAIVIAVTTLVGQQGLCGVHRAGLREAAVVETVDQLAQLRRGVRAVLLTTLPGASLLCALGIWVWEWGDKGAVVNALCAGALSFLSGYQQVSANFLRGLGHLRWANLLEGRSGGAIVAVTQTAGVVVVALIDRDAGLSGVLLGTTIGYAVPLTWAAVLLHRTWGHAHAPGRLFSDLRRVVSRDWRFAASQAGGYLNSTIELWLAGVTLSAEATSFFAATQRVGRLLLIPTTAMQVVFSPAIARLARRDDKGDFEPLVRTGATIASVLSAVVWLPLMVAPGLVLGLVFGHEFAEAVPALLVISTRYFLNAVTGPSVPTLSMAHHEGDVAVINWVTLGARVVCGFVAARLWGLTGLAVSMCLIATVGYVAAWWAARWRLGVSTHLTLRPKLSLLGRVSG